MLSNSSQSNLAIEFYYDQHSGLFLPVASNNQNLQLLLHQLVRNNSYKAKDWFQHIANVNKIHLLNSPPDGDYLFHIATQLAILHRWNDIPNNQLQLRQLVSIELHNPSNGAECVFTEPSLEELRNHKRNQSHSSLSLTICD